MQELTVTIAVCTRNRCKLVHHLIKDIFSQTESADQIIIVDDCSQDNTVDMVSQYSNIDIIVQKKHYGLAAARNAALKHCSSDIILYVDSDVSIPEDLVAKIKKKYAEYTCNALGGQGIESYISSFFDIFRKRFFSQSFGNKVIYEPHMIMGIVMSFHAEHLRSIGGFNPRFHNYGEDAECCIRFGREHIVYDPDIFVFHKRTDSFFSLLRVIYKYAYWQSLADAVHDQNTSLTFQAAKYFFIIIYESLWYDKSLSMALFALVAGSVKLAGHLCGGYHGKKDKYYYITS